MFGREYRDLADLLLNNERAKHFYKSLPQDIQQILTENGSEIRTMTALRAFRQNCTGKQTIKRKKAADRGDLGLPPFSWFLENYFLSKPISFAQLL